MKAFSTKAVKIAHTPTSSSRAQRFTIRETAK